jgi:hypothetical protein
MASSAFNSRCSHNLAEPVGAFEDGERLCISEEFSAQDHRRILPVTTFLDGALLCDGFMNSQLHFRG